MIDLMTSALASGSEALDISFYWGGAAVDNWARDGLLLDLSEITRDNNWFDKKNVGSQGYATDDLGNFYFTTDWVTVPHYFYRTDTFEKVGIAAPQTMDEFFGNAAKLKAAGSEVWSAGVVDRWPIGGVFNDILARVMPQQEFQQFVNWERNPNRSAGTAEVLRHPAAVEAWGYIERMIDEGLFVTGANAMDDATARQLFINGTTAMYDSGSWTMGIFTNDAPDLSYDYFNLPPINGNVSIPSGYNGLIACSASPSTRSSFRCTTSSPSSSCSAITGVSSCPTSDSICRSRSSSCRPFFDSSPMPSWRLPRSTEVAACRFSGRS